MDDLCYWYTIGFKVHKSYNADTVNKISISGLSTIPEPQDDMMPINEEMIVSADKRIAQHIRPTSGYIGMCYCFGSILWSQAN